MNPHLNSIRPYSYKKDPVWALELHRREFSRVALKTLKSGWTDPAQTLPAHLLVLSKFNLERAPLTDDSFRLWATPIALDASLEYSGPDLLHWCRPGLVCPNAPGRTVFAAPSFQTNRLGACSSCRLQRKNCPVQHTPLYSQKSGLVRECIALEAETVTRTMTRAAQEVEAVSQKISKLRKDLDTRNITVEQFGQKIVTLSDTRDRWFRTYNTMLRRREDRAETARAATARAEQECAEKDKEIKSLKRKLDAAEQKTRHVQKMADERVADIAERTDRELDIMQRENNRLKAELAEQQRKIVRSVTNPDGTMKLYVLDS